MTDLSSGGPLTGWTITTFTSPYPIGMNNSSGYGPTPYGSQFILLGIYSRSHNYIEQTISRLTAGTSYDVSFAIATEGYSNSYGLGNHSQLTASMSSGSATAAQTFSAPSSTANSWDTWSTDTYSFVANSSSATLRLAQADPILLGFDVGLDNVSIKAGTSSVPEPGNVALLLSSCLGGGLLLRRRSVRK